MVNYKHYVIFLLVGALLLLPVTSHYAVSWEEVRKKASALINDEKLKVPGIIVAFALAGGLYYYLTKKTGGGGDSGKSSSVIEERTPSLVPSLIQFQVYSQFNRDGGGAASCGYQTLLRGMQVISAKSEYESDETLERILTDSMPIAVYFGKNGEWRQDIIAQRKDQKLKEMLHQKFLSTLNQSCDEKAKDLYKSALGFLEDIVIVISRNPQERIKQYEFTDESIQSDLAKSLEQLKNETNSTFVEKLQLPGSIYQCFNLTKMRQQCLSEEFLLNLPTIIDVLNQRSDLQEDFAGEWLSDGELEYLWKNHRHDIISGTVNCGFKAIANFELVDNPDVPKEFDEVAFYIDENVKPLLNKKQQMFQLFGLGTMRQTGETSGTRGHWYPLVMHQNEEGKRKYYIMDSANNRDRTSDKNAWKIINLIEKAASSI